MFCQRSFKEKLSLFFRSELQEFCHGFTLQSLPHRAAAPQPRCPGRQTEPARGPSTVPAIVPAADPYRLSAPLLLGLILKRWRITLKEGNETLPVISEGLFSSYQSPGAPKGGARPSAPVKTRRIRWGAEVTAGGDARHRAIIASSGGRRRFCIQRRNVSPIAPVVSDSSLSICRRVDSSSGSRGRPGNHPCWVPGSPGGGAGAGAASSVFIHESAALSGGSEQLESRRRRGGVISISSSPLSDTFHLLC